MDDVDFGRRQRPRPVGQGAQGVERVAAVVLVVEDVIRTGLTTAYIIQNLEMKKPKDITLCSMLLNPDRLLMTIPVKYYGFEINDQWLAGYGMDRDEIGRNLPYIAQIKKQ